MKNPSPADIAEMKARGCDQVTIERVEEQSKRWIEAQAVCSVIRSAFNEVTLGNGVGLWQAQGLDDYEDDATCAAYREKDEKDDWQRITSDDLNACYSSLSFFDAEGMRFHLPAYLIADIEGEYGFGMDWELTRHSSRSKLFLLSPAQKLAVRRYLLHIVTEPDYSHARCDIERALEEYWTEDFCLVSPW